MDSERKQESTATHFLDTRLRNKSCKKDSPGATCHSHFWQGKNDRTQIWASQRKPADPRCMAHT